MLWYAEDLNLWGKPCISWQKHSQWIPRGWQCHWSVACASKVAVERWVRWVFRRASRASACTFPIDRPLGSAQGHKPSPSLRFMMFYYWVYHGISVFYGKPNNNLSLTYLRCKMTPNWLANRMVYGIGFTTDCTGVCVTSFKPWNLQRDHCEPRWTKLLLSTDDPPCAKNGNQKGLHFRGWNMASVANHCGWKKSCTSLDG